MSHASDLEWYLSAGSTRFTSSPFGRILDVQYARYIDPRQGEEKGGPTRRKSRKKDPDGDPSFFTTDWQFMHVKAEAHEAKDEPELSDLHRYGHVSSALYKLEKINPFFTSTLMAYHGDIGSRWARERVEGRYLAIYALTDTGSKWWEFMARNSELAMRPDERLATECYQQDKSPETVRGARLKKVDAEARALYKLAMAQYAELAV